MEPHAMRRRTFLKTVGLGAAALGAPGWLRSAAAAPAAAAPAAAGRPNIIFVLADDYGIEGVGCYGSDKFKTPNIDALARTGLRFETCYSAPLCGPTRCEVITGRYAFRTGGLTNQSAGRPASRDEPSVGRILKGAGYATCSDGKWRQMGETPADWGFDEYLTDPTAGGWYWVKSYTKNGQAVTLDQEVYDPDVMHEFAVDFLTRHKDRPFFLYYPMHLVHGPILRTPDSKADDKAAFYADNVAYMDKLVGKLVAELDRMNLREKTLILFSGDNGTAGRSGTIGGREIHGAKGSMWEGGARVPLIANWKGTAPEGKVVKDMVDFSDLLVTFADLGGAKLPEGVTFDGRSFAPQLRGQAGSPREWIYVQLGGAWYVREPPWKLNNKGELFDMKDAPFEEKPVPADTQDAEAAAARKRLQAVLDRLNPAAGKTEPPGAAKAGGPEAKKGKKKQKAP
jgi:arylsulfatase A